jgi:hypothetical protein
MVSRLGGSTKALLVHAWNNLMETTVENDDARIRLTKAHTQRGDCGISWFWYVVNAFEAAPLYL